jgi:DNA excision repair protein ERCC-4
MSDDEEGSAEPLVPEGLVPSYLQDAFGDLFQEDGLLCLGKGLQWLVLLAIFCRYYASPERMKHDSNGDSAKDDTRKSATRSVRGRPLVLVLGLREESERTTLTQILQSWGTPIIELPTMITNESGQAKDREILYAQGGIIGITSRILIVDLLSGVLTSRQISGLLIAHGHAVTEQSTEAFIIRIYKSHKLQLLQSSASTTDGHSKDQSHNWKENEGGFVKAITDNADALVSGFAQVDKILKALHVRKLFLYPRFHTAIRDELEVPGCIEVVELHQELSSRQKDIQSSIAVLVMQCLRQLKQQTEHLVQWSAAAASSSGNDNTGSGSQDTNIFSVENCVTQQFDRAISRQLEPHWHKLSPAVKQLVQDLRTLRTLLIGLLQYDCVTFYKLLQSLRTVSAASRYPSMWLLEPATDTLFRKAKERVFNIVYPPPDAVENSQGSPPMAQLVTTLEENPKWQLLQSVLNEIREDHRNKLKKGTSNTDGSVSNVLVMVKDEKVLETVRAYLSDDTSSKSDAETTTKRTLLLRWLRYLEHVNDRSRSITDTRGGVDALSEESRLLLEEEGHTRRLLFGQHQRPKQTGSDRGKVIGTKQATKKRPASTVSEQKSLNQIPSYVRQRRRIAVEKGRGQRSADDIARGTMLEEAIEVTEHDMNTKTLDCSLISDTDVQNGDVEIDDDESMFRVTYPNYELRVLLRCYSSVEGDQSHLLLQDIRPRYVVFYDTEVAFIRAVEVYAALESTIRNVSSSSPTSETFVDPVRVFFLMFEASAEEKNFKKTLEREQSSFERLIHHKQTMPPPALQSLETQEMQEALRNPAGVAGTYMDGKYALSVDTRRGKGKVNTSKERRDIAVDVREFRSALPSILHQGGMRLAPVTLTVGDFVLSNVHCVERKSISDLFGSFASGRLFTQVEAMSKYYACPCLLIEFDPSKSFCLQNSNELGVEIRMDSVCSKMVLLTMHFPKLRVLWSRSPQCTLNIFRELKSQHDEVDVDRAVEIGRTESEEYLLQPDHQDVEDDEINEIARDMLLRLPGVNVQSARRIMQECDSLAELCEMSRDELRRIAGPVTGQKLFTFFRQNIGAT